MSKTPYRIPLKREKEPSYPVTVTLTQGSKKSTRKQPQLDFHLTLKKRQVPEIFYTRIVRPKPLLRTYYIMTNIEMIHQKYPEHLTQMGYLITPSPL